MKKYCKWALLSLISLVLVFLIYLLAWLLGGGGVEERKLAHFSPGGKYVIRHYYPARFYAFFFESPGYIRLYRVSDVKMLYESQTIDFATSGAPISWGNESDVREPLQIHIGMDIWVPFTLPPEQ